MKNYSDEVLELLATSKMMKKTGIIANSKTKYKFLYLVLLKETSFLDNNSSVREKLYYVENNIHERLKCEICNINFAKFKNNKINCCSFLCTSKMVNPETGLTRAKEIGLKSKETMLLVNPKTGLTKFQEIGLKAKETIIQIDENGLTKAKNRSIKSSNTMNTIVNPETGLTIAKEIGLKSKETLSKINPETGENGHKIRGLKSKETMLLVNPKTGLTKFQEIGLKTKELNLQVNPETGLNGYQTGSLKTKEIRKNIKNDDGLNSYQLAGLKTKELNLQVNPETGLNGYQTGSLKTKEIQLNKFFPILKLKIEKFGFTLITTIDKYLAQSIIKYSCNKCGSIGKSHYQYIRCLNCHPYNKSIGENEVLEYVKSITSDEVLSNSRQIISPLELDIYIPEKNIAIEYNGLYWHSFGKNYEEIDNNSKNYHLNKTELCNEKGIQLLHIFENEWLNPIKQDIWKSIINNKLVQSTLVGGRKTRIGYPNTQEVKEFLENNHLQGYISSSINLGLYYENELISLMTFGRSRFNQRYTWELLRFCNRKYTSVIGGASKLFRIFRDEYEGSIISYCDMRRGTGGLYRNLVFELSHISKPNYYYFKSDLILFPRQKFQKHKLEQQLEVFDKELTESQNMYNNGFRKIYDCGNQVWIMD